MNDCIRMNSSLHCCKPLRLYLARFLPLHLLLVNLAWLGGQPEPWISRKFVRDSLSLRGHPVGSQQDCLRIHHVMVLIVWSLA